MKVEESEMKVVVDEEREMEMIVDVLVSIGLCKPTSIHLGQRTRTHLSPSRWTWRRYCRNHCTVIALKIRGTGKLGCAGRGSRGCIAVVRCRTGRDRWHHVYPGHLN